MDAPWLEVIDYLKSVSQRGARVAAHERLKAALPDAITYQEIGSHEPEFIQALVIHKGLYEQIEPSFLHEFMARARPTFANEVFVVLRTGGVALKASHPHLGVLRRIARWAGGNSDRAVQHAEEPPVSADIVLRQMADFIVDNLAKPLDPSDAGSPVAIAETAERFNDTAWFWADDSAKVAELFAVPQLRDAYPELADATLNHVLRLSTDRIIQRRLAAPQLKLVDGNPASFSAYNSFFSVSGNLQAGIVQPSIRFNDGRTRLIGDYSGNVLRFRYRGRLQAVDVEAAITRWGIDQQPDRIVFSHTSSMRARPLFGPRRHVCDLTYRYSLWKARPVIELEVEITTQPRIALDAVQLSTAFDQLTASCSFDTVTIGCGGRFERYAAPPERVARLHSGAVEYIGIGELAYIPGFSIGLHVRLRDGAQVDDVIAEGSQPGRFHWLYTRYALNRLAPGQTRRIVEDRLLTGGGYYDEPDIYCRVLNGMSAATDNVDPSMSYDIGAELNAVATTLLFARRGRYRVSPGQVRLDTLKSWYDRHLDTFLRTHGPGRAGKIVFIRGLSFVILSLDCMIRAFGLPEYHDRLQSCVEHLLGLEQPVDGAPAASIFSVAEPELDCHGAALLALARAAVYGDPQRRISGALARALRGTLILQFSGDQYGHANLVLESLWIRSKAGGPPQDGGFWVYKLAVALRAFNAIRQVQAGGFLQLEPPILAHLEALTEVARRGVLRAVRRDGGSIEVLTSAYSGETNSETQPWAALGLAPAIEWELYGRPGGTDVRFSVPDVPEPPPPAGSRRTAIAPIRDMVRRVGTPEQIAGEDTQVEVIRTVEDLDRKIEECNQAEAHSDDAMRTVFGTFRMEPPGNLPLDPFSPEYHKAQMQLYEMIAGKEYSTDSERSHFDIEQAVLRPFPFYTESCTTSGDYIAAIGFLLRAMALSPRARVIEFGAGWGLTSIWLAQLGHDVTVVEIDRSFCDVIARRAAHENVRIEIINDDFSWISRTDRKFDCALFFECFHHSGDHLGLLRALSSAIDERGAVYFAAEPVLADFPMPWGLRLDGNSLWAIRKNGWLELGFREDYFLEALRKTGWWGHRLACDGLPMAVVWRAQRLQTAAIRLDANDARVKTAIGVRRGAGIELTGRSAGTGLYGPYLELPRGPYVARIYFADTPAPEGTAVMDISVVKGSQVLAKRAVEGPALPDGGMAATLPFESAQDMKDVEVRLFCEAGFRACVSAVEVAPVVGHPSRPAA